jgi:NHL repeat
LCLNSISGSFLATHVPLCNIDDPACDTLRLYEPSDVKIRNNALYIADTNNHLIRIFDLDKKVLRTLPIRE